MSVAIIVPVLGRPHRVEPTLRSIADATPEPYRVLFVADPDDVTERRALESAGADVLIHGGRYASKINAGIRATTEPLIFAAADDLRWHGGWLEAASAQLGHQGAASSDPVAFVGTQDLNHRRVKLGTHATHPLVTRAYVEQRGTLDEAGKLYHEGYWHNCVDVEAVETAKFRRVWAFAYDAIVEHLHPGAGKAGSDDTYRLGKSRSKQDRALWLDRRARLLRG